MDIVFIRDLRINTIVGVHAQERDTPQTIRVDVELGGDFSAVCDADCLEHGVDYQHVSELLTEWITGGKFATLEALAAHCADGLRSRYDLPWARVTASKPEAVAGCAAVGVRIERGHRE